MKTVEEMNAYLSTMNFEETQLKRLFCAISARTLHEAQHHLLLPSIAICAEHSKHEAQAALNVISAALNDMILKMEHMWPEDSATNEQPLNPKVWS